MLYTSFRAKTPTLYFNQNSWQVGFRDIFKKYLIKFFFLQHIFPFVSLTTIYAIYKFSRKNIDIELWKKFLASRTSWHFRTKFNKIFFFLQNIFPFVSWTSKCAIYKFSCKKNRNYIPVKILSQLDLGAFSNKF